MSTMDLGIYSRLVGGVFLFSFKIALELMREAGWQLEPAKLGQNKAEYSKRRNL
jgi:hypothetical protein